MGMFEAVSEFTADRGPYYVISLDHEGPYQGISTKIEEVSEMLTSRNIKHSTKCVLFFDDPARIPVEDLRSQGGFLVSDSTEVDSPFVCQKVPVRYVAVASIEANSAVAWFKTFLALEDLKKKNNLTTDTLQVAMELYHPDGLVEVELPIKYEENY